MPSNPRTAAAVLITAAAFVVRGLCWFGQSRRNTMRRLIAGLVAVATLVVVAACGPDQPQKDWSKYSAPVPLAHKQFVTEAARA